MKQDYKHPITPPPELVQQWASEWMQQQSLNRDNFMATRASQYGADQELEACCEWLSNEVLCESNVHRFLRAARRPKPPSLKEQALLALSHLVKGADESMDTTEAAEYIRRALEQLPDPS
jgi:hypothetical protein